MRAQVAQVTYLDSLEEAWAAHLAPRADDAPTVVSTFAGCGGSSLGYSMAGFRELLAVEWDQNAVDTFRLNFPEVPVYHGDIAALSVESALERTGLVSGALDVLDGSPPCQGFSTAGKRVLDDPRNQLFREFVRLLQGLQPKVFVMENVSGMVKGKMRLMFVEILRELKACGYRVSARLLNAMYFGVPQSRERMIFVGVRSDLGVEPSHPKAATRTIAAGSVIAGCAATRSQRINPWMDGDRPAATICKTAAGYEVLTLSDADLAEAAIKPTHQMYRVLTGKERGTHFGLVRVDANRPSPTIQKSVGGTTTGLVHLYEIRRLAIPEVKRLASFPDEFQMLGKFADKWARIGNSVPPLFMRAIAQHIRETILTPVATLAP